MVYEIVQVEVGQCGYQIDNAVWNALRVKPKLTKDGKLTGNTDDQRRLDNTCMDNLVCIVRLSITLLLMKITDNYANRIAATFSVHLSPKVSDDVIKPYDAILILDQLLENSDETSEASYNISHNTLKQLKYALRFSGKLNVLAVFSRLCFFAIGQSPLFAPINGKHIKVTVQEITDEMWSSRNFLANVKPELGKYLSASRYRGNLVTHQNNQNNIKSSIFY